MDIPLLNLGSQSSAILDSLSKSNEKDPGSRDLQAASRDFESVFMSMLLKEMRNSLDQDGEGGLFAGEKSDTLGSLFDMYLGQHMASANSLGIAQAMQSYLKIQSNAPDRLPDASTTSNQQPENVTNSNAGLNGATEH